MAIPEGARTQFKELVQFKAPEGFSSAVATAARLDHMSVSEFIRRCTISRLREMGLQLKGGEPA